MHKKMLARGLMMPWALCALLVLKLVDIILTVIVVVGVTAGSAVEDANEKLVDFVWGEKENDW